GRRSACRHDAAAPQCGVWGETPKRPPELPWDAVRPRPGSARRLVGPRVVARDDRRQRGTRVNVELAEDPSQVALDRLLAQEQRLCALGVALPRRALAGDFALARGERGQAVGMPPPARSRDALAEPTQLAGRAIGLAYRPAVQERALGGLELMDSAG